MPPTGADTPGRDFLNERFEPDPATLRPASADMEAMQHVAIIMDGNGRWAERRGLPRLRGHHAGAERVREIVEACPGLGIRSLTLYAFSTENWRRSGDEVAGLMALFRRYIRSEAARLKSEGVRVRFIGDRGPLDARLRQLMGWIEEETRHGEVLDLVIALNYGGRDEMVRAARCLARAVAAGRLSPEEIDARRLADMLDTASLPDPDVVIRTSGEARLSNFLLWQSAYAELAFTKTLWPDFTPAELASILDEVGRRQRRFGAVPAPAANAKHG